MTLKITSYLLTGQPDESHGFPSSPLSLSCNLTSSHDVTDAGKYTKNTEIDYRRNVNRLQFMSVFLKDTEKRRL
ncbi:hypothetical protein JZ751_007524 [Albula glossodonta]|uniref:Uncharacterized protein n=1 Tax=Albula glossodonta TaxID=121402 RepID=A0A8T2N266_9TELE|nr:hypothetical protein JZ751_007524 [Albula glossodonta]